MGDRRAAASATTARDAATGAQQDCATMALLCMRPQWSYSSSSYSSRPYLAAVLDRIKGCFSKEGALGS